jgi:hypothetical protein
VPYDLSVPGRVTEIKHLLIALGNQNSDFNYNPSDPQTEDTFKYIDLSPDYADSWDGPTADAFALTVGRHVNRFPALMPAERRQPLVQLPKFKDTSGADVVVGGPQPTVAGLELLAQASKDVLKGASQLQQYLAWRGGVLDCLGAGWLHGECTPPDQLVVPTTRQGKAWDPRGLTVAWRTGPAAQDNPELLSQLNMLDQSLETSWLLAPYEQTEAARKARADAIVSARGQRDQIARQLNKGATSPSCEDPASEWSPISGKCEPRCALPRRWDPEAGACVVDVAPATYSTYGECMTRMAADSPQATVEEVTDACDMMFPHRRTAIMVGWGFVAVAVVGGYFLFRGKKIPELVAPR